MTTLDVNRWAELPRRVSLTLPRWWRELSIAWRGLLMTGALSLLWLVCLLPLTLHNTVLPYRYHADERTKAEQVLHDMRNFHHPLLLVESAQYASRWWLGRPDPQSPSSVTLQRIVEVGRFLSAAFAATAIAALALTAYWMRGWLGMLCVGVVAGLSPSLLIYAHDFKEDTALVMGLALVLAGLAACYRYRNLPTIAALGVACGLAVSGKYVGIVGLAIALPVVWTLAMPPRSTRPSRRRWRLVVLLATFVAVTLVINHRALMDWPSFAKSFSFEARHGMTDHDGVTTGLPNVHWLFQWWRETTLPIAALAGLHLLLTLRHWRQRTPLARIVALSPAVYLTMLTLACPIPFNRYLLPVMVLTHFIAGLGVLDAAGLALKLSQRFFSTSAGAWSRLGEATSFSSTLPRWAIALVLLLLVSARQAPLMADYLRQFPDDSRRRLDDWLRQESPGGMRILSDFSAGLPLGFMQPAAGRDAGTNIVLSTGLFAAEWGSLDNVRSLGITHVAMCELAYDRYVNPMIHPTASRAGEYESRRAFYQGLLDRGEIIWDSQAGSTHAPTGSYTNPRVLLVKLPVTQ